jgi:polyvinyl alcohol dehydrogenase (cytochrome)
MLGYDLGSTYWNKGETKITKKTATKLDKAWDFDGQGSVTSTPVISGGKVYVVSQGVIAIDLVSGKQLWTNPDLTGSSSLALSDGVLYVNDSTATLRALRVKDGTEIWNYKPTDLPDGAWGFSSPIVTKDYVLYSASTNEELALPEGGPAFKGFVAALHKDGKLAWTRPTVQGNEHGVTVWSTVSVDETLGIVYAATGNNHNAPAGTTSDAFLAIPLKDGGDFIWTKQIFENDDWWSAAGAAGNKAPDDDFGANPVVFDTGGKKLVAGGNKGGDFWVLDRAKGEFLTKSDGTPVKPRNLGNATAFKGGVFTAVAWDGKRILTACNNTKSNAPGSDVIDGSPQYQPTVLYALDPLTLDILWERGLNGVVFGPITVANGVGFVGKDKTLQAFDTEKGDVLYEFQTEATIASAPAISNGYVVFGSGITWIGGVAGTKYYALKVP